MAKNNFLLSDDWKELFKGLPNEQAGELIKAIFDFHSGEDVSIADPVLAAVFSMISSKISRNEKEYQEACRRNATNGGKGGRPSKAKETDNNPEKATKTETNRNKATKTETNRNKATKTETNRNGKNKPDNDSDSDSDIDNDIDIIPLNPPEGVKGTAPAAESAMIDERGFHLELRNAVEDWLQYKREKKQKYQPTGLKSLLTEIGNNAARYGEDAVIDTMRKSMAAGYTGIVWDWLKKPTARSGTDRKTYTELAAEMEEERIWT